eukprot:2074596-Prymnesium_polylepis.1
MEPAAAVELAQPQVVLCVELGRRQRQQLRRRVGLEEAKPRRLRRLNDRVGRRVDEHKLVELDHARAVAGILHGQLLVEVREKARLLA